MTDEVQYTDEYFINLKMPYDQRDDEVYCKWAVWCAKSDDHYYLDGKDGYFFTHERTIDEIRIEKKRREVMEMMTAQSIPMTEEGHPTDEWIEYEHYLNDIIIDPEILNTKVMNFEEWNAFKDIKEESIE